MPLSVQTVDYFYTRVEDQPGKAYELLAKLASERISLLAFSAVPFGDGRVELTIFPEASTDLIPVAKELGWKLVGPQHAFLIRGDDQLGALADLHRQLFGVRVNVYASTGVTDGQGRFAYIIYVNEADFPTAARALGV